LVEVERAGEGVVEVEVEREVEGEVEVEGGCGCAAQSECRGAARGNKINYAE
jgi:hypothetical protein